jgi:hypothetical protein
MSSKCDVSLVAKQIKALGDDSSVSFESYLLKAAAKSFSKVFPEEGSNISRVHQSGLTFHKAADE